MDIMTRLRDEVEVEFKFSFSSSSETVVGAGLALTVALENFVLAGVVSELAADVARR